MIVEKLELRNFQNYEYETIEFEEGVSLFYGPNGSGKSTILRGIFAGLFQTSMTTESAVNYTIGDLIKKGKDEGSVTITFIANNNRYTVEWELENYQGSSKTKSCTLTTPAGTYSGVRNVAEKVESVIGMDAQSFVNSVYVQQLDMMELISSSASTRKKIFDGLLGFRQIDEYIERAELAKREINSLQKDKKTVRNDIEQQQLQDLPTAEKLNSQISSIENKLENKKSQQTKLQNKVESLQEKLDEIEDAREELAEIQDKLTSVEEKLTQLEEEQETLKEQKQTLLETKEETSKRVSELQSVTKEQLDSCEFSLPDTVSKIETEDITTRIETLNKTITTKREKKSRLETELSQAETTASEKKQQKQEYSTQVDEINSELETVETQIEELETIKTEVTSEYTEVTDSVADTIGELLETLTDLKTTEVNVTNEDLQKLTPDELAELSDVSPSRITQDIQSAIARTVDNLTETKSRTSERISEKSAELDEIKEELEEIQETSTLELEATFWNPHISSPRSVQTSRTPTEIREDIATQLDEGKSVDELTEDATQLYNALLQQNNEEYNSLVSEKESLEEELTELREKRENISADLQELDTAQTICNTLQDHTESLVDLYEVFDATTTQLQEYQDKHSSLESEKEELQQKQDTLEKEIEDAEQTQSELKTELQKIKEYLDSLNTNTDQLKELRDQLTELESAQEEHDEVVEKIEAKTDRLDEISTEISSLKTEQSELQEQEREAESQVNQDPEALEKKLIKLQQKEETLKENIAELQKKQTKLTVKKENREEHEQRVSELDAEIARLSDRKSELDSVTSVYSNVKKEYRKQAIAYINEYTNQIFQKLYTNKQYTRIEIDEEYAVRLHTQSGETIDPQFSSGGEGAIVNIAIRAGIYRVISEQSGQSKLPPFILDEPTTFLDSEHIGELERFIQALRDWDVTQVFLVSHEERLIDSADLLYEISLDGDNNSSVSVTHQ